MQDKHRLLIGCILECAGSLLLASFCGYGCVQMWGLRTTATDGSWAWACFLVSIIGLVMLINGIGKIVEIAKGEYDA